MLTRKRGGPHRGRRYAPRAPGSRTVSHAQAIRCHRVGVTGSTGKTTTKDLIGSVSQARHERLRERGQSQFGDRAAPFGVSGPEKRPLRGLRDGDEPSWRDGCLVDIVRPDLAAITNIGTAHIGLLGSRHAIASEKKRIFGLFDGPQTGFVFEEEPYFSFLKRESAGAIRPYGPTTTPGYEGSTASESTASSFRSGAVRSGFPLVGEHNLVNALCGVSVADQFGVPLADVAAGFESVRPLSGRGEVCEGPSHYYSGFVQCES